MQGTLGLITPPRFESDEEGTPGWAIIVSYDDEGHVPDDDAAGIDYDELLTALQKAARDGNAERQQQGYGTVEIVGWAERPHYESSAKKLYWAKHLRFDGDSETLHYDIRSSAAAARWCCRRWRAWRSWRRSAPAARSCCPPCSSSRAAAGAPWRAPVPGWQLAASVVWIAPPTATLRGSRLAQHEVP